MVANCCFKCISLTQIQKIDNIFVELNAVYLVLTKIQTEKKM